MSLQGSFHCWTSPLEILLLALFLSYPRVRESRFGALGRQRKGKTDEIVVMECPCSGSFRVLSTSPDLSPPPPPMLNTAPGRGGPYPTGQGQLSLVIYPWTLNFPSAPASFTPAYPWKELCLLPSGSRPCPISGRQKDTATLTHFPAVL